jgi:hypothetical protein
MLFVTKAVAGAHLFNKFLIGFRIGSGFQLRNRNTVCGGGVLNFYPFFAPDVTELLISPCILSMHKEFRGIGIRYTKKVYCLQIMLVFVNANYIACTYLHLHCLERLK